MDKKFYHDIIEHSHPDNYKENDSLAIKAQAGDIRAKEELVQRNSKFIYYLANKYVTDQYSQEDLFQDGVIGMLKALHTYKPESSSFTTYAFYWIKAEMRSKVSNISSDFYYPVNFSDKMRKYERLKNTCPKNKYSKEELAEYGLTQLDFENVEKYKRKNCDSIESLSENNYFISSDDLDSLEMSMDELLVTNELCKLFDSELKKLLKPMEESVIRSFYGIGVDQMNMSKIAKQLNRSRQYIGRVRLNALEKLSQSEKLAEFIDF